MKGNGDVWKPQEVHQCKNFSASLCTIDDFTLFKSRLIAVCFKYIRRMSDKALITARFLALAEIHLGMYPSHQRSTYQLSSLARHLHAALHKIN